MSYSLNDPRLQALEARLAAMPPQLSMAQQQQLLYQCAFAAGRTSARHTVRRWQAAAAGLMVVLVGLSVPLLDKESVSDKESPVGKESLAGKEPRATGRRAAELARADIAVEPASGTLEFSPLGHRPSSEISLDAWQVQSQVSASFDRELAQFARSDPRLRSLAVGPLTRRILEE